MRWILGAVLAVVLLLLYGYSVSYAIYLVHFAQYAEGEVVSVVAKSKFEGYNEAISLIGGLVSALVIAVLAATPAKEQPSLRNFNADLSDEQNNKSKIVIWTYMLVWLFIGLASYIFGKFLHNGVLEPLTTHAQSWLGFAITATYAYFGLSQKPHS